MKLLAIICSYFVLSLTAIELPEEFFVKQRWLSLTTTFDIETHTQVLGTVHRELFSFLPEYHLKDPDDNLLAKARMRFFPLLAKFDIMNAEGMEIGTVEEEFTLVYRTFRILSATGQKLALAKMNFWGTKFTIKDFQEHEIATLSRSFFRLKDDWTINILDPSPFNHNEIHPHVFLTLIAFQADYEYWKAHEASAIHHSINAEISTIGPLLICQNILKSYQRIYDGVTPEETDFAFVESLEITLDEENLEEMLSSEKMTQEQKAALWIMLENRIAQLIKR